MGNVLKIRTRALPEGWYPSSKTEIQEQIDEWEALWPTKYASARAVSGIVPHAGWFFCGSLIFRVLAELKKDIQTVVILGGHNPANGPLVVYPETGWETAFGVMEQDSELVGELDTVLDGRWRAVQEISADNTVEVVMALLAALRPSIRWAAWRVPADKRAVDFGRLIADTATRLGRKVAVLGSTDLTHYGRNYGFMPHESLGDPVSWVRENDLRLLDALTLMNPGKALELADSENSACSIGAALAAMGFAATDSTVSGRLLEYAVSRDKIPSSSFVGYGALVWETREDFGSKSPGNVS